MITCRVCMQQNDEQFISIFSTVDNTNIAEAITNCCSVQLTQNDGLPDQICHTCVQDVKLIISFIIKVQESDFKLRQLMTPNDDQSSTFEMVVVKTESSDESRNSADVFSKDVETCSTEDDTLNKLRNTRKKGTHVQHVSKKKVKRKVPPKTEPLRGNDSFESTDKVIGDKETDMFQVINLPSNSFVCCSCCEIFDCLEALEVHVEMHTKNTAKKTDSIYCTVCKRKFKKHAALKRHQKNVNTLTQLFECVKCKLRFMNSAGRRMHTQKHPKNIDEKIKLEYGEILCCVQNCSKPFETEELLIQHGREAHKLNKRAYELGDTALKPVECPVCFKRFPSERLLRRHKKRNSRPLNHQCATCGLKFRTKDVLALHELNHENQKPFQCDVCKKYFSSKSSVKVHQRSHSNERPFICSTCGAGFFQKAQLTIHEHNHTNAPLPFQCEVCDKTFKMKNYLINHMRQHTGERPYPCRHCPMSFSNYTNRQRHEMNHTGNKPFKCSYCDKTFTIKRLQLEHECKHTGIKPYKCSYCDKTFIRKRFQVDHESTHTGVKPYRCEMCNRTFSQKTALRRHLESHPLAPENELALAVPSPMPGLSSTIRVTDDSTMSPPPVPMAATMGALIEEPGPSASGYFHARNLSVSLHPTV
ncbi:zinc finger protein 25-like isoform X4 [Malaya genurostris]|nr:zinc finger protein 25-like isoform X4 [Malaya genurostris]XP_058453677.1 zinc finger protein 25-like isoform X4 [Malaya genurostris]